MTSGSILVKVLIVYFSINAMLYAGGFRFSDSSVFSNLVGVNDYNASLDLNGTGGAYDLSGDLKTKTPNLEQDSGSTILQFIDVVRAVAGFLNFLAFMIVGLPVIFFQLFPPVIQLFVGVPLSLLALVGLIYFARSGQ